MPRSNARRSSDTPDDCSDLESLNSSDMSSISASTARYSRDPSPVALSTDAPTAPCTRSNRWCFQPQMVIVRAGDTEFQVPKEILLPSGDTKSRLAYLVNKPRQVTSFVDLHDIDPKALDVYLSLCCPHDLAKGDVHSVQDWTLLLEFSTYMGLDSVRELAIERLDPIASPVDKIVEGTACGVDRWLVPSITELCAREKFLTLDESIRLGVRRVHLIASVREDIAGMGPRSKRSRSRVEAIREMVQESLCEGDDMTDKPKPPGTKSVLSSPGGVRHAIPVPASSSPRPETPTTPPGPLPTPVSPQPQSLGIPRHPSHIGCSPPLRPDSVTNAPILQGRRKNTGFTKESCIDTLHAEKAEDYDLWKDPTPIKKKRGKRNGLRG